MAINFYSDVHLAANKLGRDADNLLDFSTDNQITFRVGAGDGVIFKASGEIEATKFDGALEGNADTATALATARNIGGVSFNGTANIDLPGVNSAGNQATTGNADTATLAETATHVTVTDNESTNENNLIPFIEDASATGNVGLESDGDFHYNPRTGLVTATAFGIGGHAIDDVDITAEFVDADAHIMSSKAIGARFSLKAGSTSITTLGTISEGVWNGDTIHSDYLHADTAHLTTAQTFTGSKTMGTDVKLNFRDGNSYIHSPSANDLEIVCTDLVIDTSNSIAIETSDLTMYDPVNGGNPTLSIGSSATNRFEIKTAYNSSAQTIDEVYFSTYTTSTTTNDGRYIFEVDEVELGRILDGGLSIIGFGLFTDKILSKNTTASSATEGGKLVLQCDDGAAMGNDHRLGVIEFSGAEDASNNRQTGASIQAMCDAAWSASENGTRLEFYTMDGNAASELSLTLDSDKVATFAGDIVGSRKFTPTGSNTAGTVTGGDIGYFGSATVVAGKIYHYKSDGSWELSDPNSAATSDGLLGVALDGGTASDVGMLLRGMVTIDHDPGAIGDLLYLSADTTGTVSSTAPSGSGDVVRTIGYQVNHASNGEIWFNPSTDYIILA